MVEGYAAKHDESENQQRSPTSGQPRQYRAPNENSDRKILSLK
jgi:hypothetical protein